MSKYRLLAIDIDGTLVDSNDMHTRCWIEAFARFGLHFEWDEVRHQIGKGGDLLVPDMLNAQDSIFVNGGRRSMLAVKKSDPGYVASIALGVHK